MSEVFLCSAEARVAALVGLIAGAIGHHSTEALVRAPLSIMIATVAIFAAALMNSRERSVATDLQVRSRKCVVPAGLVLGVIAGYTLPSSAPASWQPVVTHAAVHSVRNDMFEALDVLDTRPATLLGRRISVTGVWQPSNVDNLATVSQRVMACCAADAVDVGFDVVPARMVAAPAGAHVQVGGIVTEVLRQGETRYVLRDALVKALNEGSSGGR
ncbi:MAG TPA: hypothetical protein VN860_04790 [Candidatus Acidoferrales bacterium]|nr:hypothetical protein [Candidatus Acidoferrales bacterium]